MDWIESYEDTDDHVCKVITVGNHKGGVGKTSLCYALAHNMFASNYRVLLVDMDKQGSLGKLFKFNGNEEQYRSHRLSEVYKHLDQMKYTEIITPMIAEPGDDKNPKAKIDILLGDVKLYEVVNEVEQNYGSETELMNAFENLVNHYKSAFDFIIFDTTPVIDDVKCCRHALSVSDCIVVALDKFAAVEQIDTMIKAITTYSRKTPNVLFAQTMYHPDKIEISRMFDKQAALRRLPPCIPPVNANDITGRPGHDERRNIEHRYMLKVFPENMCVNGIPSYPDIDRNNYFTMNKFNRVRVDNLCCEILLKACIGAVENLCDKRLWGKKYEQLVGYMEIMRDNKTKSMKIRKTKDVIKPSSKKSVRIDKEAVNRRAVLEREARRNG